MPIDVDFGNVKQEPLPEEGDYILTISGCEIKAGKKKPISEACVLHLNFEIAEGDYAGKKVKDWVYVEFENPWSAQQFFEALFGESLEERGISLDEDQIIGERIGATLEVNEFKGRHNLKPTAYFAA